MSKVVIISAESSIPNEIEIVNKMLATDKDFRFHLRKPNSSRSEYETLIKEIDKEFHSRISIHNHLDLKKEFPFLKVHLKENNREGNIGESTSYHKKIEAIQLGADFEYFFCSPVFNSLSKKGYITHENWNINAWSDSLKEKAFALGGITADRIDDAKELGFKNFAFLGAVWLSEDPIIAFKNILKHVQ